MTHKAATSSSIVAMVAASFALAFCAILFYNKSRQRYASGGCPELTEERKSMAKQAKQPRIETEPDAAPLALSLGALLRREEVVRTPEDVPPEEEKAPKPPRELPGRVILTRETKGRGGKTVTRLSFREGTPSDPEGLAKKLRAAMGCGGTLEGDEIVLQGDQIQRAAEWFAARRIRVTGAR